MGGRGAEKEAYELGRVLEELPPGALGLDPDRRNHLLPRPPLRRSFKGEEVAQRLVGFLLHLSNGPV